MTDKQKTAIRILNSMHERKFADDEEYFLLLDFIVGQQQVYYYPLITEPKPIIYETDDNFVHKSTPFDPQRNYEPDGIFGSPIAINEPTMQGESASSITESMKAKDKELSYGEKLIKEGRSPL